MLTTTPITILLWISNLYVYEFVYVYVFACLNYMCICVDLCTCIYMGEEVDDRHFISTYFANNILCNFFALFADGAVPKRTICITCLSKTFTELVIVFRKSPTLGIALL